MLPQCLLISRPMKLGKAIIAGTMMLLAGCGVADQYSALPKVFRQPGAEPPPPEPEPDVKELIRAGADTLFTGHPSAVAVSRPRRVAGRGFDVCVKAVETLTALAGSNAGYRARLGRPRARPAGVNAGGDLFVRRALKARRPLHHSGHG